LQDVLFAATLVGGLVALVLGVITYLFWLAYSEDYERRRQRRERESLRKSFWGWE
jgi:hypothetical protein